MLRCALLVLMAAVLPLAAATVDLFPATTPEGAGVPAGWVVKRDWIATRVRVEAGPSLVVATADPQDVMANRRVPVPKGSGPAILRGVISISDLVAGAESWQKPQVQVAAFDAAGAEIKAIRTGTKFAGAVTDQALELRIDVTPEVAELEIRIGFLKSSGRIAVRELTLSR
ncbi:MAG: hypothetical protein PF961_08560 [Planctomycetota bacterium]|jgi:hypothetical protein|nr:hypothetical protein [Planctomycetota bacterium]